METPGKDVLATFQDLERYWNPADLPASEAAFQALSLEAKKLEAQDPGYSIELAAWIARAQALQGRFAPALETLKRVEALIENQESVYRVAAKIRWLIERGRLYILEKTPSQARGLFSEAWALSINSGEDHFAVEIAQLMAATEPPKSQQDWILRGIELAENSPLPKAKKWLGGLYANLGWKLFDLRQYDKALETFQRALRHSKAQGSEREAFIAQWSVGKILRVLGKTEEALSIQKTLLAQLGIGGKQDGRLYEELAECLQELNRAAEAQTYFELAYLELSKDEWVSDNRPVELKRLKDLGKVK